jgi:3-oxoacyl-[acyl-carrier-protein] synthase-1
MKTVVLRRVVVTGMGLVSCLGSALDGVSAALRAGRGGIRFVEDYRARGFACQVAGVPVLEDEAPIARKLARFMGMTSKYAYYATRRAIADAGLAHHTLVSPRTGAVIGSGVGAISECHDALEVLRTRGLDKVAPYIVPRAMSSTTSACIAGAFDLQGITYSPASACTTSTLALGQAFELIQMGRQDVMLAGGAEELDWMPTAMFDVMGALSHGFNDAPQRASRPYDVLRDGLVLAGGAGIVVLEEREHALARGATIYGEVLGYGCCTIGADMVVPSAAGMARAMRSALEDVSAPIDYLNAHAPSTQHGDLAELAAVRQVFGEAMPAVSSIKGLTGHALGACGAQEAIYTLLMLRDGFVAGCANLDTPDPALDARSLVRHSREAQLHTVMSNNFGFGGTYASLVFARHGA